MSSYITIIKSQTKKSINANSSAWFATKHPEVPSGYKFLIGIRLSSSASKDSSQIFVSSCATTQPNGIVQGRIKNEASAEQDITVTDAYFYILDI